MPGQKKEDQWTRKQLETKNQRLKMTQIGKVSSTGRSYPYQVTPSQVTNTRPYSFGNSSRTGINAALQQERRSPCHIAPLKQKHELYPIILQLQLLQRWPSGEATEISRRTKKNKSLSQLIDWLRSSPVYLGAQRNAPAPPAKDITPEAQDRTCNLELVGRCGNINSQLAKI